MGVKYYCNEKLFERWSPEMAYLLGYIYADGSLEDASYLRGKYLRLTSADMELILLTKQILDSAHSIVRIKPKTPKHKWKYLLRIGSHKIYDDLTKLGLYPNKSLTMQLPDIPKKHIQHFVRGYFDGDGHVSITKNRDKFSKLIVVFISGSSDFLKALAELLCYELDLKINKIYKGWHNSYRLAYSTNDSVKIFKYLYSDSKNVFLSRKYTIFKKFFLEYNKWVDHESKYNIIKARWRNGNAGICKISMRGFDSRSRLQ